VNDIKKKIQTGTRPQDIAIIVKKNVTIRYISALLRSQNIPVYASTKESLFDMDIIRLISKILRYVHSLRGGYVTEEREILVDILAHPCFHIHRLTLWQISRDTYSARNIDNKSWIENLRTHADSDIRDIAYFFIDLSYRAHTERLEDILDIITGACTIQLADEYDEDETKVHIPQIDILGGGQKSYISPIYTYFFDIHTADICTNIDSNDDNISNIKPQLLYTEKIQNLANLAKYTETVRSFKQ
jgi:superfamily I DNA/RNA helicase